MENLMYDPDLLTGCTAELEQIRREHSRLADEFNMQLAACPAQIRQDPDVQQRYAAAQEAAQETLSELAQLEYILGEVNRLYRKADEDVKEKTRELNSGLLPDVWMNPVIPAVSVQNGSQNTDEIFSQETRAVFSDDLDIPDWMLEELAAVKQKSENEGRR